MQWDIFDNNVTFTRVAQAKSAQRKAESLARENLETIRLEVHNAYTNLKIAEENIKITAEAIEQAKEKFLIAQFARRGRRYKFASYGRARKIDECSSELL